KNVKIEAPIQTLFWQEDNEDALFNHVIVVADEGSSVTYVENYFSQNETEKSVSNIVAEVYAHDNAYVSFGGVDHFAHGTTTYISRRGIIDHNTDHVGSVLHLIEGDNTVANEKLLMSDG